jgi:hypothetical protein
LSRWNFREEETFERCVAQMGGAEYMDRALAVLTNALSLNPRAFPFAGYGQIRLARTRLVFRGREVIPALSVRFYIEPPKTVVLLHVEQTMPEEMEASDEWPWQ